MNPELTMTAAITALAAEKHATGYKYAAEERVLARFAVFSADRFPGQQAPTRDSVHAWITDARGRGVKPATLHGLVAPVRELARCPLRPPVMFDLLRSPWTLPGRVGRRSHDL
ncbi:hypothetical protein [Nocardia amamiensis]|uniref:hypothetical protein n=1 Tax=Nocardia amamiensis TaxID=404578 RepID=UPI000831A6B4|nr:hypothetical protein [Nocardia amamiensis]